jgi:hypothetical protein
MSRASPGCVLRLPGGKIRLEVYPAYSPVPSISRPVNGAKPRTLQGALREPLR